MVKNTMIYWFVQLAVTMSLTHGKALKPGKKAMEQGSEEWRLARLAKITASRFSDVMTNGRARGTMGKTAFSYMRDLIAEELTGKPQDEIKAKAIDWGNENEPHARAMYCFLCSVRVVKIGFVQHPQLTRVGGSPDGLVDGDLEGPGGVEIKCPMNTRVHLEYLELDSCPDDYKWQVQGLMWVTGRKWWDFVSYDPRLEVAGLSLHRVRCRVDHDMHRELDTRIPRFIEQLEVKLKAIRSKIRDN